MDRFSAVKVSKRFAVLVVAVVAMFAFCASSAFASATNVANPRVSNGVTTWDCVWFGSYPQTEVSATTALANANWDSHGDAYVNGVKYHRLKKADATYATTGSSNYYDWAGKTVAYFKYEPIKWRVLELDGTKALLVSDVALDDQRYNLSLTAVTWATCTMRSWLNGYGSSSNSYGISYSSRGFLYSAFDSSERADISSKSLTNADNIRYGTEGGSSTTDKVFLLAESDVWSTSRASLHGFSKESDDCDMARRCKTSSFAHAMGAWKSTNADYAGNCYWWLRSPGDFQDYAARVGSGGDVLRSGSDVVNGGAAVRPASWVDLGSSSLTYAGTVSSDGTSRKPGSISCEVPYKTARTSTQTFYLDATAAGGTSLSYKSSSSKVKVSSSGKVTIPANYLGTPTITITSAETSSYTEATKKVSVKVRPKKMAITKAYSPSKHKVKLTWSRPYIRSGFQWQIIRSSGGKWEKASKNSVKSTKSYVTYYSKTGLKSGYSYKVRLRVYKTYNGTKYYGPWSVAKSVKVK